MKFDSQGGPRRDDSHRSACARPHATIKDVTRATDTAVDGLYFFLEAKKYLTAQGLMQRAELVDTTKARAELAST